MDDAIAECRDFARRGYRALVTVLTKKMAEDLTEYMHEQGLRVRYMHSDVDTLERIEIIRDLRLGAFDVLVGINLLREGLDIPECGLVAILDADKEGFLRSETSPHPDNRPGRAQRRRQGDPLRRQHHRLHGAGHEPRPAGGATSSPPGTWNTASRPKASRARSRIILASPYERGDRVTIEVGVAEDRKPFLGSNFQATLRDLEGRMRTAAATWNSRKPPACATRSSV